MNNAFKLNLMRTAKNNLNDQDKDIPLEGSFRGFERQIEDWFTLYFGLYFLDYYRINQSICIDIGAFKGLYSSVYARHFSYVHAFEASPYACLHSKSNFKRQQIPNITLHEIGILNYSGTAVFNQQFTSEKKFHIRGTSSFNLDVHSSEPKNFVEQINLPVRPLDSFKLHPSFLKIDADGTELKILEGGFDTISKSLPFIQAETCLQDSEKIDDFLFKIGYKKINLSDFSYIYPNLDSIKDSFYIYSE